MAIIGPRKAGPGRLLTEAEVRERAIAGRASAAARHHGETSPSVRQGSSGTPSRQAASLFRQGQQRPDTRARRGVWDTRSTEPEVGSTHASFTFHFPKAMRSKHPDPSPKGRGVLGAALARKTRREPTDLTVRNPGTLAEAHRHPEMRELINTTIGVVRDHQKGAIDRAHMNNLIPEGTRPGLVNRAYKHAALLALHRAGLGDYDFHMDPTAKADFAPLEGFMRYAHRRVFDQLNVATKGKWAPFREEFGHLHVQMKHGKPTGATRMRMRDNQRFIKIDIGDDEPLEKAWARGDSGDDETKPGANRERPRNKNGHNAHSDSEANPGANPVSVHKLAAIALARAAAAHKAEPGTHAAGGVKHVPPPPQGDFPTSMLHAGLHMKHAAIAVERHLGVKLGAKKAAGARQVADRRTDLRKLDLGFMLGSPPPQPNIGGYNTNPATQLKRAIHPRLRRRQFRLRLNTQRHLRRVLGGGVTRQERWQLGASTRLPANPFKISKRSPVDIDASAAQHPTEAQALAGNYRMGHTKVAGLNVSIETPKGKIRRKVGFGGRKWQVRMPAHYGYIKRTEGGDGDHLDVYLGPHAHEAEKHPVFVVDQHHTHNGRFDEHKAMLGFRDLDHATRTYDAAFSDKRGPERRKAVHEMTAEDFRHWVGNGDTKKSYASHKLKKGILGNAIGFGARFARTPARIAAGARRIAAHPRVAGAVSEARGIGRGGFLKSPVHSTGRILGRAVGGERGARIGGAAALTADYAPEAVLVGEAGRKLLGQKDVDQRRAQRKLRQGTVVERAIGEGLGKGLVNVMTRALHGAPTSAKVGLAAGGGLALGGSGDYLADHPGARAATGAALTGGAAALLSRGRALGFARQASRKLYSTGIKQAVRDHLKVLEGATPSPHHVAQMRHVRRKVLLAAQADRASRIAAIKVPKTKVVAAAAAGAALGAHINNRMAGTRQEDLTP